MFFVQFRIIDLKLNENAAFDRAKKEDNINDIKLIIQTKLNIFSFKKK